MTALVAEDVLAEIATCKELAQKYPDYQAETFWCRYSQDASYWNSSDERRTLYKVTGGWDVWFTYNEDQGGYKHAVERVPYFSEEDLLKLAGKARAHEPTWSELAQALLELKV